jgi:replication-associated recombination protein RarA
MKLITSSEDLMKRIANMDRVNSVIQFSIPGKGKFTLVLQEEDENSIKADAEKNSHLKQMIEESQREYRDGKGMSTSGILKSLSVKDFE